MFLRFKLLPVLHHVSIIILQTYVSDLLKVQACAAQEYLYAIDIWPPPSWQLVGPTIYYYQRTPEPITDIRKRMPMTVTALEL